MAVEGIHDVGSGDEPSASGPAASSFGATITRGGIVCPMPRPRTSADAESSDTVEASRPEPAARKVGFQYTFQVLVNSLPLLTTDIVTLTAVIAVCRFAFLKLGFIAVGMNVSACLLPMATGFVLINTELGLYPGIRHSPVEEFRRLIVSVTGVFAIWAVAEVVLTGGSAIQRWFLLVVYLSCLVAVPVAHAWIRGVLGRWKSWGFPVLICGNDPSVLDLYDWIKSNSRLGLRPVGIIADPASAGLEPDDPRYAGPWSAAEQIAVKNGVYWAVVIPPNDGTTTLPQLIAEYLAVVPHIHVLSELTGLPEQGRIRQHFEGLAGIDLRQNLILPLPRLMKRLLDIVVALLGGLVLLPLLFYIAVAVKLSSRGPILYGHERIGQGGRRFLAWKFRTMFANASEVLELYLEAHPGLREEWEKDHKLRYDPRVTKIGRFLRLTSLDELPQLWNVICGQMSLVGPRPIVTAEIAKYGPYYGLYTMVTPGITGLWQVSGRNDTTYEERVQLDAYYVRNWSPWMDLYLLVRTIRTVLFAEGAY
jgi:Undecaprenyl-phosphate galactose phosphotransferase WbaP